MAIIEIEDKNYKVEDKVAEKIFALSVQTEELELKNLSLKKQVLDGEIHWHSQKQKRMLEKRRKLKYRNIVNELEKYLKDNENNSFDTLGAYKETLEKLRELKGSEE